MTNEPLFKHERIEVFVDQDKALRAREYTFVVRNRKTGEEAGSFTFRVSDSGRQVVVDEFSLKQACRD